MKHHSVFTREQIVDAGFDLIRQEGWRAVSVRSVADKIGCSTMPIYSHFRSIGDLEKELLQKADGLLKNFQRRSYSDNPLLDMAVGYVVFARDEKLLFRFLYLERPRASSGDLPGMRKSFLADFGEHSPRGQELVGVPLDSQEGLMRHTWIFTHGLAMLVNAGVLEPCSNETIRNYLTNAGGAFYIWMTQQGDDNG